MARLAHINHDGYCNKYMQYCGADNTLTEDSLNQLEKNYEEVFESIPEPEELEDVFKFMSLFLAEIGETCPNTRYSKAASDISFLLNECEPLRIAENLARIRI